jgi:hypothetical protein
LRPRARCKGFHLSLSLPLPTRFLKRTRALDNLARERRRRETGNSTARSRARTRTHRAPFRPCHVGGASARFSLLGLLPALPCPLASPLSSPSSTITMTLAQASPPGCCRACSFTPPPTRPDAAAPARRRRRLPDPHPPSSSAGNAVRSIAFGIPMNECLKLPRTDLRTLFKGVSVSTH